MSKAFKDFDLSLAKGHAGEKFITLLGTDAATIEVKSEQGMWRKTGNIAIEYCCNGVPSGIAATKAGWWAHILCDDSRPQVVLVFNTQRLKEALRSLWPSLPRIQGGDGNRASLILFPLNQIHTIL